MRCRAQSDPDIEKDKAKKRAERFGTFDADLEAERKAKRAERFGTDALGASAGEQSADKLAARAARFGISAAAATGAGKSKSPAAGGNSADFEALKKVGGHNCCSLFQVCVVTLYSMCSGPPLCC